MPTDRITQLIAFLEDEPNDPFTLYAIANEYIKVDILLAKTYFERLLADFPDYLATYYQAGKMYEQLRENEKAIEVYKKGCDIAHNQGNTKTERELKSALIALQDEETGLY